MAARRWPALEGHVQYRLAQAREGAGQPDERVLAACHRAESLLTGARRWREVVGVLGVAASAEGRLRRLREAEASAQRAMAIARRTGGAEEILQATLYLAEAAENGLHHASAGILRRRAFDRAREERLHDYAAWSAEAMLQQALAAGRTREAMVYGDWLEDHLDELTSVRVRGDAALALGDLAAWRGRHAEALAHYRATLAAHRTAGSRARVFTALSRIVGLVPEGPTFAAAGAAVRAEMQAAAEAVARGRDAVRVLTDWSRAELTLGHAEAAHRIASRALAQARNQPAATETGLATLQLARVEIARKNFGTAVALLEPVVGTLPDAHGVRLMGLDRLAVCYLALGRPREAAGLLRETLGLMRTRRAGVAPREALRHRGAEHALAVRGVAASAAWHASGGGEPALESAWWFREMAVGRLLTASIDHRRAQDAGLSQSVGEILDGVERAHARVVASIVQGDEDEQRASRRALAQAHEALARIEARAARSGADATPGQGREPGTWAGVRAALPADTAILAFALGAEGAYGMVTTREGGEILRLGDADAIHGLVTTWRRLAAAPGGPEAKLAGRLYDRLVAPFGQRLATRTQWIVLCDGVLAGVPIDAWIRSTPGGGERLLERHTVRYGQGHAVLEALTERARGRAGGRGLLALGDPTYPPQAGAANAEWQSLAALDRGGLRLPVLPASAAEARAVAALYPPEQRTILLAAGADRDAFLAAAAEADVPLDCVHVACHGLVDDALPSLSGLVFAGGTLLTAERLLETRLPVDLTVLSACQSGGESPVAGEGLQGLTQAFLRAGATRVICSTWQVPDASTAELMALLHEGRRREGLEDADALRRARLAVMRAPATAHPYFWAGFQLWGPGATR
jgi:CHAT domain-containing protein/tetratricopeptide (TPR) repeat protein